MKKDNATLLAKHWGGFEFIEFVLRDMLWFSDLKDLDLLFQLPVFWPHFRMQKKQMPHHLPVVILFHECHVSGQPLQMPDIQTGHWHLPCMVLKTSFRNKETKLWIDLVKTSQSLTFTFPLKKNPARVLLEGGYPKVCTPNWPQIKWRRSRDYPWSCGVQSFWIRTISCVFQLLYRTGVLTYRNGLKLLWEFEIFQPPFGPCGYNLGSMDGKLPQRTKKPNPSESPTISLSRFHPIGMGNSFSNRTPRNDARAGVTSKLTRIMAKGGERIACERKFTKGVSPSVHRHIWWLSTYLPPYLEDHARTDASD